MKIKEEVASAAVELAEKLEARAIVVLTETGESFEAVAVRAPLIPVIAATASEETYQRLLKKATTSALEIELVDKDGNQEHDAKTGRCGPVTHVLKLLVREVTRAAQTEDAIVLAMSRGIIREGDVLVVVGSSLTGEATSIFVYEAKKEKLDYTLYEFIKEVKVKQEVFESTLNLALEIGAEGREGRLIGTSFMLGDSKRVIENSRQLILNPFEGHIIGERVITSPEIKETVKGLAQLDGAFVITEDGIIEAAGRYLTVDSSKVDVPRGLGVRHAAVAAMTKVTDAIGITVSQSGGIVRIFDGGEIVLTVEPHKRFVLKSESFRTRKENVK